MLQWMRDVLLPQVPQGIEGLLWQEEEGCEPCQEELWPQGVQGQWPVLGQCHPQHRCSADVLVLLYFVKKYFVAKLTVCYDLGT